MPTLDFSHNFKVVERKLNRIGRGLAGKAGVMALNKTIAKGKTEMKRAITSEYNIRAREVSTRLKVIKSRRGQLVAELNPFSKFTRGRGVNLIEFLRGARSAATIEKRFVSGGGFHNSSGGTRKRRRPVFRVKKQGAGFTLRNTFIAEMNSGKLLAMQRTGSKRYPIKEASTIDVPQMFNTRRIKSRVTRRIRKEFPIEYARAAKRVVARIAR